MTKPPCIICGRRRGHGADVHEEWRLQYRRTKNLLRRTWPRFRGLRKLLDWYASREPARPVPAARQEWACRVLRSGEVVHVPVTPSKEGEHTP